MNLTTAITAPARPARRLPRQRHLERKPTPFESRILSLSQPPVRYSANARPSAMDGTPRSGKRPSFLSSRTLAECAFWLAIVVVFAGGAYFIDRGGQPADVVSRVSSAHRASAEGSGRIPMLANSGDLALRVGIEAVAGETDYWFWCYESSAGLPVQDHFCRNTGIRDPVSGYTIAGGIARVGASSASDVKYYVQLYCPNKCRWWVETTPAAASASKR